jgi:hypothetical protein
MIKLEKYPSMKVPNLITEFIQHFYVTDISYDVQILRYTRQMECYNGFIVISNENIIKVLFMVIKNNLAVRNRWLDSHESLAHHNHPSGSKPGFFGTLYNSTRPISREQRLNHRLSEIK